MDIQARKRIKKGLDGSSSIDEDSSSSSSNSIDEDLSKKQGRKKAMSMLKNMLEERRAKPRKVKSDFFDYVLEELDRGDSILTEGIALDLMFVLLFASFETTSLAIIVAIRLLGDNPRALQALAEEHENILRNRENKETGLTWKEYKSMTFTFQLINEIVHLANIVPGVFRKALKNIKFKDYTIPTGWAVMVCPPAVHLNPANYKDPLEFNPWRWEIGSSAVDLDQPTLSAVTGIVKRAWKLIFRKLQHLCDQMITVYSVAIWIWRNKDD
ncbi:hypothetical protein L6452_05062 [Arctium lappa]|uniref:Uncharacterized protein n=1 Tax=Arctium lappa TaxID=4217 RepID=A0ACB9EFC0_ARCLA|nr:hypothetical protein L6452_05062 [Arctium lappa]